MGQSYYKILGIERNATEKEIKRAYALLLRKYPPEKFPDEFSEIAEAYDVLSNIDARKKYNESNGFNETAQQLMDEAMKNYHSENYENAIKYFKRFILLEPSVNSARNYLSICYARLNDYDTAYKILNEVFSTGDEIKEVYFDNMFYYCDKLNKYKDAENYMLKALDTYDTLSINFNLVKLYSHKNYKNIEKATEILINKVDLFVNTENYDIDDLLELCYYSANLRCYDLLNKYLSYIKYVCDDNNIKYVIKELFNYAELWISVWEFEFALKYIETVIDMSRKSELKVELTNDLIEYFEYIYNVCSEAKEFLQEDKAYTEVLNYIFSKLQLSIVGEDSDNKKRIIEELNIYIKELETACYESAYAIKDSLSLLKKKYRLLYSEDKEGIDKFYNIAINQIETYEKNESNYREESAVTSRSNINSNNSTSSSTNSNSGGGCGTILIFMIIGGAIGGPIGVFIGALIGGYISNN